MKPLTLDFDEQGYLKPATPHLVDFVELLQNYFDIFPNTDKRLSLLNNWITYNRDFQNEIFLYYEQWINGSFVTLKESPKDIDIVTFLDYRVFEYKEKSLDRFWSFSLEDEGIDAYIVKAYPVGHALFNNYLGVRDLWLERFQRDRNGNSKGFLKIFFEKEIDYGNE